MKKLIKSILFFLLNTCSKSMILSINITLLLSKISKNLLDRAWKAYLYSLMSSVNWKNIKLPPQKINIGGTSILLTPHIHEFDYQSLFWQNFPYEKELYDWIQKIIKNYDTIVDIGANVGIFSLFAAQQNHSTKVYSFEPSNEAFFRLSENKRYNNLNNLSIFNAAVADKNTFLDFYEPEGHLTNGSLDLQFASIFDKTPQKRKVLGVDYTFIEQLAKESHTKILIKIDVEGAESIVLSNLKHLILQYKPDIIIEVLPNYEKSLNTLNFILEHYQLFLITTDGLKEQAHFVGDTTYRDYFLKSR